MENVSQAPKTEATDALQSQRQAFTAEVTAGNAADAARLGHVASRHEVHADASGVVMTPKELAEVQAHGHPEDRRV